jgi:hypothetical protein
VNKNNRYNIKYFNIDQNTWKIKNNEIIISDKYGIVISLEENQNINLKQNKDFIVELIENIPFIDNEVQNYFCIIEKENEFSANLLGIIIEDKIINLSYCNDCKNNGFDVTFEYKNENWELIKINQNDILQN